MAWLVAWCVLPVNLRWMLPFGAPIPRSVFLWDFLEGSKKTNHDVMWFGVDEGGHWLLFFMKLVVVPL